MDGASVRNRISLQCGSLWKCLKIRGAEMVETRCRDKGEKRDGTASKYFSKRHHVCLRYLFVETLHEASELLFADNAGEFVSVISDETDILDNDVIDLPVGAF